MNEESWSQPYDREFERQCSKNLAALKHTR
jgi:hypothetical protein